jgi:hypothetical protein
LKGCPLASLPTLFSADNAAAKPTIAYGTSFLETVGRMAGVAVQLLGGAKPGEVPISGWEPGCRRAALPRASRPSTCTQPQPGVMMMV